MRITINNQIYQFDEKTTLENAVDALQLEETKGIALALNEEIIPRSQWKETILTDEDKIIVIGAVAGGWLIL